MTQAKARYIMLGGFLGAGKSTTIGKLAEHLHREKGLSVGLITNDQGHHLVDTMNLKQTGFPVEEIPGGCFCCRFHSLMEAAEHLSAETRPDVFIAEPVGSCTDLVASVSYPLRRLYGDQFVISPLNVLVDPRRALAVLGLRKGPNFSDKVIYIYKKQLEEAATIVVNKADLLKDSDRIVLVKALEEAFPNKPVVCISARTGEGLQTWFESLWAEQDTAAQTMALDYGVYAEGEALLGWFNSAVKIQADQLIDGDGLLSDLASAVQGDLNQQGVEIAHFKMTLMPNDGSGELAAVNLVGGEWLPELAQSLSDPLDDGELVINLRAEGTPEQLQAAVEKGLKQISRKGLQLQQVHCEAFKPSPPQPVYRMNHVAESLS